MSERLVTEAAPPAPSASGDLGIVQSRLCGTEKGPLEGDGSFTLLRADTEGAAVEVLADWLAAETQRDGIVVVAERPTGLLDAALRRRHLPRMGVSSSSALRGLIQVLQLALATRWRPFDAVRTLELLQIRHSPIPREVRTRLLDVLPDCPGRGGAEWHKAIDAGLAAREERLFLTAAGCIVTITRPRLIPPKVSALFGGRSPAIAQVIAVKGHGAVRV